RRWHRSSTGPTFQRSPEYLVFVTACNISKINPDLAEASNVHSIALDVTSTFQLQAAVTEVAALMGGKLDILINNAGNNYTTPILDTDVERAKEVFKTNVWGPFLLTQSFAPLLIETGGMVVNISFIAGELNTPYMGIYSASKAALTSISETLRLLDPLVVKVLAVFAGNVKTQFWSVEKEITLPKGSKTINEAAGGKFGGDKQSSADHFSDQLFTAIVRGRVGAVWQGALAGSVRWVSKFAPSWLLDKALSSGRGLDQLRGTTT
ncbi:hypothetical protein D6C80_07984, partial [Aureobasidium pullulans]